MSSKTEVKAKLDQVFEDVFKHDGFAEFKVEMKFLKRDQKQIVIHCGKQYRYTLDYPR